MPLRRNNKLLINARNLRKNMTSHERHLWYDFLSRYPVRFYKQRIIGNYIADFYCSQANLIIELDGSQHYQIGSIEYDKQRTEYFNSLGIKVVRFTNSDVDKNFQGVCALINRTIRETT